MVGGGGVVGIAAVDAARDFHRIVLVCVGIEAIGFPERGGDFDGFGEVALDDVRIVREIDACSLAILSIIVPAGQLDESAAAEFPAVAGLGIAEIGAATIDGVGDQFRFAGVLLGEVRISAVMAERLDQALGGIVETFLGVFEPAGFDEALPEEMTEAERRVDVVALQRRPGVDDRLDVAALRAELQDVPAIAAGEQLRDLVEINVADTVDGYNLSHSPPSRHGAFVPCTAGKL